MNTINIICRSYVRDRTEPMRSPPCCFGMRISDKQLVHDMEVLRHGGDDAVLLLFERARKFFDKGGSEYVDNWIRVANPALPETTIMR
jgi:hypothetical protein